MRAMTIENCNTAISHGGNSVSLLRSNTSFWVLFGG